jgi:transcriptional regulator with XRE-family HTH domain
MGTTEEYQLVTPEEMASSLAGRFQQLRLMRKWKQSTLAQRAGISLASLRRFEQTGEISLKGLLRLAFALRRLSDFESILQLPPAASINELAERSDPVVPRRKRGSQ